MKSYFFAYKYFVKRILVLFVLLIINLFAFSQLSDAKITPFSEWKGKSFPIQNWVSIFGDTIKQSTLGNKVCFFNFFSNGCPPCMKELKYLNNLMKQYSESKDVIIIGFYCGTKERYEKDIKLFRHETMAGNGSQLKLIYSDVSEPKYSIVPVENYTFRNKYNAWGVPSNLIIDKQGIVRFCNVGFPLEETAQVNLYSEYVSEIDKLR